MVNSRINKFTTAVDVFNSAPITVDVLTTVPVLPSVTGGMTIAGKPRPSGKKLVDVVKFTK